MGRGATKAAGNIWYEARINAAKWNDRLNSREGAAELLGVSVDVVNRVERGLYKCMPVDLAVLMADLYHAPQLTKHYCKCECPIGCEQPISDEVHDIDRMAVLLMKNLDKRRVEDAKEMVLDIAADGEITDDELDSLETARAYLKEIAKVISEFDTVCEIAMRGAKRRGRSGG